MKMLFCFVLVFYVLTTFNCSSQKETQATGGRKIVAERTGIMDTITVVINGSCVDSKDQKNIAGATVKLTSVQKSVITQSDWKGNFKFNHIPAGKYSMEVLYLGYRTLDTTLTFSTGDIWKLNVRLAPLSKKELEKMVEEIIVK